MLVVVVHPLAGAIAVIRSAPRAGMDRRSAEPWDRLIALARQARSAADLLAGILDRPVTAELVTNQVMGVSRPLPPLLLGTGSHPIRILEHLLRDSAEPVDVLGFSTAIVVRERLSIPLRAATRRGVDPVAAILDSAAAYWTAELLDLQRVSAHDASWTTIGDRDLPMLRATRLISQLATPVALVVEEVVLPA